ncbi:membrane protein [Weizmannia acidilactici]|uniref:Membrane protein n=1 Tax=Weizmannia acidilactici TaxID=2607726 RepID=A0A5J4JFE5_9BACI|nr:YlaH-like family protein [Weizmannia acidilactici]GER68428.1 membrane protein [Weizmannia acidilactici]GER70823.1 membrane protein [Weizmannia acidilactici]GER74918.1 membrane protein [Weizmannia acidilactici]
MTNEAVHHHLSFFASLYKVDENPDLGMWLLYATITVLCMIVYRLGFARKLPVLKSAVIYVLMMLGCTLLTFFSIFLPVAEALFIAAIVLGIYKIRLRQSKKTDKEERFPT